MDSTSSPKKSSNPTRKRRWIVVLVAVGLAGCAGLGVLAYDHVATEHDWRSVEAEIDALEPRWRLAELEADRPPIADADNAAVQILLAHGKAPKLRVNNVKHYNEIFAKLKPNIQLNEQQIALIQGQLDTAPDAIAEARKLKDMPRGRFAVQFSVDYITTPISQHDNARTISDWLMHDAYLSVQVNRNDEALDNCRAILNIGRTIGDDRSLITRLGRLAQHRLATETAERILAQGIPSKESLLMLQTLVAREMAESSPTATFKSERAGWHHMFVNIRNGKLERTYLRDLMRWKWSQTVPEKIQDRLANTMMHHAPDALRYMNRRIEISQLPLNEQKERLHELTETGTSGNPICGLMSSSSMRIHDAELRSQAMLRTMLVGLACARYRLEHQRWPTTLDVLVAEKLLAEVPLDPVDGQPLRYRRDAEGIVVYSIGCDEKDNGGILVREPLKDYWSGSTRQEKTPDEDISFRLWNEPRRRGIAIPSVPIQAP